MIQEFAAVTSIREAMPGVYLVWLESPRIAATARPGQFVMVRCGTGSEFMLRRPLSIHQRDALKLALLFTASGKGTRCLAQSHPGDKLDLLGPLGNGFGITARNLLLVAGGIGIAPLQFLAQEALKQGRTVTLLVGAHSSDLLYPEPLLPSGARLVIATEDGVVGHKGMITELLPNYVNQVEQIFACGPNPMYQTMAKNYQKFLEKKPVQVSLEVRMGCGTGVCYACTVKTRNGLKQACKDGPVFDFHDILWDEFLVEDRHAA